VIDYADPQTFEPLVSRGEELVNPRTGVAIASVQDGIPRFVEPDENYAESFGFQWKRWHSIRSDSRNPGYDLKRTILERTHFDRFDLAGKTLLECGMGGGDDTEVLLTFPFGEVHSFDMSTSVERAAAYLKDDRLRICQASIYQIPYPDESFDVVYCHRVLQHTPDPAEALRCICKKVKPGGLLFAHAYKRSRRHMAEWRYKYRWLTRRLPWRCVAAYVDACGPWLHRLNKICQRTRWTRSLAYRFIPFYHVSPKGEGGTQTDAQLIELEKAVTFDALTPWYDSPMRTEDLREIIEAAGFRILHLHDPRVSPVCCTAVREKALD
jgi:SAM-dependent methyltransferase